MVVTLPLFKLIVSAVTSMEASVAVASQFTTSVSSPASTTTPRGIPGSNAESNVIESLPPTVLTTIWLPATALNGTITVSVRSPVAPAISVVSTRPGSVITNWPLPVSDVIVKASSFPPAAMSETLRLLEPSRLSNVSGGGAGSFSYQAILPSETDALSTSVSPSLSTSAANTENAPLAAVLMVCAVKFWVPSFSYQAILSS